MGQSWSGIKKRLEQDLLADSLRGRVHYFITKYKNSHDESGRVAILVDDKEVIQGNIFRYYDGYREMEGRIKSENQVKPRVWTGKEFLNHTENLEAEDLVDAIRLEEGYFDVWQFTNALEEFLNLDIQESQNSKNPLIRLFAVLDRRTGKKTLMELSKDLTKQQEWLQFFYELRFKAEQVSYIKE